MMALPEDQLQIDTPENVAIAFPVAGIGSRFLAAIIDTLLIAGLQVLVNVTLVLAVLAFSEGDSLMGGVAAGWLVAAFGLLAFVFFWGYYIFFDVVWNGQSPGKRIVGLRVIRQDGMPISLAESAIRNILRLVDFLPISYGVGLVTMFFDRHARRLGDLAAGTLVVWDRKAEPLRQLISKPVAGGSAAQPEPGYQDLAFHRLERADVELAADFLRRGDSLSNRYTLGLEIARSLLSKMGDPNRPITSDEAVHLITEVVRRGRTDSRVSN